MLVLVRVLALMKVPMTAACLIEVGDNEGSDDGLFVRVIVQVAVRF